MMTRTDKVSKAVSLEQSNSFDQAQPTERKIQFSSTFLSSVLTVALLSLLLIGSFVNDKLFFNELASVAAIALLILLVKSKSQPST